MFFFVFALPRFANSDRWFRDAAYLRAEFKDTTNPGKSQTFSQINIRCGVSVSQRTIWCPSGVTQRAHRARKERQTGKRVARSVSAARLVAPPSPVAEVSAKKCLMVSLIFIMIKIIVDLLFAFIGVKYSCAVARHRRPSRHCSFPLFATQGLHQEHEAPDTHRSEDGEEGDGEPEGCLGDETGQFVHKLFCL